MGIAELKSDLRTYEQRLQQLSLATLSPEEFRIAIQRELADNLVPLLSAVVDVVADDVMEQLDELGGAVDQLIDQSEDLLQPTTAAQIQGVLAMGVGLVKDLEKLLPKADDLTRKRLADGIQGFRLAAAAAAQLIQTITLEDDGDGDGAPPGEDGGEGEGVDGEDESVDGEEGSDE